MATIIAKNTTGSSVLIEDLGIEVDAAGQLDLSELFDFEDISNSDDLKSLVSNGTLIINDGASDLSISDGLDQIYHQTVYEDSFEDGGSGSLTELTSVQIRRTTGLALTTSWQDITFDTTDIENNIALLEHSDVDLDRILIKSTGHYFLYYSFTVRSSGATRDCLSRVMKNDVDIVPGADTLQNLYQEETHQQSESAIVHLDEGDFLTLQVSAGSEPVNTMAGYVFHLTKLEGITGAKGDQGIQGIKGDQGIQGLPGENTILDETSDLDEAKITEIETTSSASPTNPYLLLVQIDNRSNNTIPSSLNGDMSTHVVMFDGNAWYDLGLFVGIKGDKGDTGDTGADGNSVLVQKDDVDIMANIATLNFTGDATITTSPSSKINVEISPKLICQVYDDTGGTNINTATGVAVQFRAELYKDSIYDHSNTTNPSRVYINKTGIYDISYSVTRESTNKATVHTYVRKNGTTVVLLSDCYIFGAEKNSSFITNTANFFATLSVGDYIEVLGEQAGANSTEPTVANQCWLKLLLIREV